ncbi:hypothetical protein AAC387_Pa12g0335 [Persea americana]
MQVAACRVSVRGRRRWGRRKDDAGAGAVCAVVTSGSAGGERGVPGWCLGCLFCTWEEGGDDAAQGGGRREAEVVPTGCTEHA